MLLHEPRFVHPCLFREEMQATTTAIKPQPVLSSISPTQLSQQQHRAAATQIHPHDNGEHTSGLDEEQIVREITRLTRNDLDLRKFLLILFSKGYFNDCYDKNVLNSRIERARKKLEDRQRARQQQQQHSQQQQRRQRPQPHHSDDRSDQNRRGGGEVVGGEGEGRRSTSTESRKPTMLDYSAEMRRAIAAIQDIIDNELRQAQDDASKSINKRQQQQQQQKHLQSPTGLGFLEAIKQLEALQGLQQYWWLGKLFWKVVVQSYLDSRRRRSNVGSGSSATAAAGSSRSAAAGILGGFGGLMGNNNNNRILGGFNKTLTTFSKEFNGTAKRALIGGVTALAIAPAVLKKFPLRRRQRQPQPQEDITEETKTEAAVAPLSDGSDSNDNTSSTTETIMTTTIAAAATTRAPSRFMSKM